MFEHLLLSQLQATASSYDQPIRISSYRTAAGAEVDFIVETAGTLWAIEAKASTNVGISDLKGLKSFAEFFGKPCRLVVAYLGEARKQIGEVTIWPWQELLMEMFHTETA